MSASNDSAMQVDNSESKGKGKATEEVNMEEDDSSSDEEVEVCSAHRVANYAEF